MLEWHPGTKAVANGFIPVTVDGTGTICEV